ncbi:hypothetical protein PIB30_079072 [Stylosanthes scabra]|uniref:Uncharacterized protein n=1 Tax=Stylosanthes scabra TaxID=79078 RepID=A0ABU6QRP0_9FABA|nr:hypothetical protein [Stylosanthes scabra]
MIEIGNVTIKDVHQSLSKQVMEEAYSYDQGYTPWDPPPSHPLSQNGIVEAFPFYFEKGRNFEKTKGESPSIDHLEIEFTQFTNGYSNNSSNTSQPSNSGSLPSQPLSIPKGSINTLFLCTNQEGREDTLLNEEVVECHNHEEVYECLGDVEVESVDQQVEDVNNEPKGINSVHSVSSGEAPPKLPSELHFEWVNPSDMNFLGHQHYVLLETDGQLKSLCGVLDKKEMESLELDESRFISCGKSEFKSYSRHLHKLHNSRAKVGALSLRKHLGSWQFQEELVDSQNNGWNNQESTLLGTYYLFGNSCKLDIHDLESHKEHKFQALVEIYC